MSQLSAAVSALRKLGLLLLSLGVLAAAATAQQEVAPAPADTVVVNTLGAAFAGRREKLEGSLEPAKLADLIIVSQDLFKIAPSEIAKTEVLLTMVGGKVVYQSPRWVGAASTSAPATEGKH